MIVELKNKISRWPGASRIRLRFDNYAWITACEVLNIELHQLNQVDERKLLIAVMFGAYVSNCRANAQREKYNLKDIYTMFARLTVAELDNLKEAMLKSRVLGKTLLEWAGNESATEQKKK
jgi:hypothetical protein